MTKSRLFLMTLTAALSFSALGAQAQTWSSGCETLDQQTPPGTITRISITASAISVSVVKYTDATCGKLAASLDYSAKLQITLKPGVPYLVDPTREQMDHLTLAQLNEKEVAESNRSKICGKSDWKLNEAVSMMNLPECGFEDVKKQPLVITLSADSKTLIMNDSDQKPLTLKLTEIF